MGKSQTGAGENGKYRGRVIDSQPALNQFMNAIKFAIHYAGIIPGARCTNTIPQPTKNPGNENQTTVSCRVYRGRNRPREGRGAFHEQFDTRSARLHRTGI